MDDKITFKNYPCGKRYTITKKFVKDIQPAEYGALITSEIVFADGKTQTVYYETINTVEEIKAMLR